MAYINGKPGQIYGNFPADAEIIDLIKEQDDIVDFYGLKKLGIQASPGLIVIINDNEIKIGKTGIYELDYDVYVKSLKFKTDVTDVQIDYVW